MKRKRSAIDGAEQAVPLQDLSRDAGILRTFSRRKTERTAVESEHPRQLAEIAEDIRRLRRIIRVRGLR